MICEFPFWLAENAVKFPFHNLLTFLEQSLSIYCPPLNLMLLENLLFSVHLTTHCISGKCKEKRK